MLNIEQGISNDEGLSYFVIRYSLLVIRNLSSGLLMMMRNYMWRQAVRHFQAMGVHQISIRQ
jgi:hypothetical protein